jgi:hypothetical protein
MCLETSNSSSKITLIANRKDLVGKDSRAVGMSDLKPPFTEADAEKIVPGTKFISEGCDVWRVEVAGLSHAGTLVEATAEDDCQYSECLDKYHGLPPAKAAADIEEIEHHTS